MSQISNTQGSMLNSLTSQIQNGQNTVLSSVNNTANNLIGEVTSQGQNLTNAFEYWQLNFSWSKWYREYFRNCKK
jgi:hypothetical protein